MKKCSRRDKTEKTIMQSILGQEFSSIPKNTSESSLSCELSDKLIIFRKEIRTCTNHFMANFVSYDSLSPSDRGFVLSIFSVFIT